MKKNLIIGIDPGLKNTGWGVIENFNNKELYVSHGVIKTTDKEDLEIKLKLIYESLNEIVLKFRPSNLAVEKIFSNSNPQSTLKLGKARGMAFLVAAQNNIKVSEYSPNTVKKNLVGYGHANKFQIIDMIKRIYPESEIKDTDAADALAVATCHSMQSQSLISKTVIQK